MTTGRLYWRSQVPRVSASTIGPDRPHIFRAGGRWCMVAGGTRAQCLAAHQFIRRQP